MDYDKLIERWRNLANRWENGEQLLLNGAMRIEDELRTAATAIETLRADLARVTAERDAAIADWRGFCAKCAWNGKQYLADGKMDDRCRTCRENGKCNWKWRGIKED